MVLVFRHVNVTDVVDAVLGKLFEQPVFIVIHELEDVLVNLSIHDNRVPNRAVALSQDG